MAAHAPMRVGRYVLHEEIASGGMGTVYLGRLHGPSGFSRIVAVKRVHPLRGEDKEAATMLLDEARLASRIRHPNVVPMFDTIDVDGDVLLVMEYVHGESLARLARAAAAEGRSISPAIATAIVSGMLYGLHAAHEATDEKGDPLGLVHRDVSPANVIVGVDGIARVVDFGVAKAQGRLQTTRDGSIKGKIAYMSPEQLEGRAVDRRGDIWAAGVVLWELLTGKRLFKSDEPGYDVTKVLYGEIVPPARLVPDLKPGLNAAVMRALERAPSDRFPSARAMSAALLDACAPAPPHEVGEWVEACAHEILAARAARIAEIEALPATAPAEPAKEVLPPPPRRRTGAIAIAIVALLAGGALVTRSLLQAHAHTPEAATSTPPANTAPPAAATSAPVAPPPTPSAAAAPPSAPPEVRPPRRASAPPATTSRASCDPPYTRDQEGHKIWKRECFEGRP